MCVGGGVTLCVCGRRGNTVCVWEEGNTVCVGGEEG